MDHDDIQGIVLHGYRHERFARYYLLTFGAGEPRRALARLVTDVSSAAEPRAGLRRQFAVSASGLRALGLAAPEIAQFSREFRQGMAHPERSLALGDVADESPEHWEFGGPNTPPIDALWMTFADSAARSAEIAAQCERLFERFGLSFRVQVAELSADNRDHFGYPLHSAPAPRRARRWRTLIAGVPPGEFVLGERDAIGERTRGPLVSVKSSERPLPHWVRAENALDFGRNGSYLVLRKLDQDVRAFRARFGGSGEAVQHALAEHRQRALGAEGSLAHRLIRRSRPYDDSSAGAGTRGLWFMALNADIRRQFEFVQARFNAERTDAPLVDPFVGRARGSTLGERAAPARLARLRGGGYFFLPSVRALNYLAEGGA